jgi:type IV/VI secretion system ImpK/VasF family protein
MPVDSLPAPDGAASLFIHFRNFWVEVQAVRETAVAGGLDAAGVRAKLRDVLRAQQPAQGRSSASSSSPDVYREAQYVMAAVTDDVFVQLDWTGARDWMMHPLELDLFGSRCAGQRVFERIDALLAGDGPHTAELAGIYAAALALGFRGMYAEGAFGEQKIAEYRAQLQERTGGRPLDDPLVPQCYEHTIELPHDSLLSGARAWWWGAAAVVGAWLIVSSLLWYQLSGERAGTWIWAGAGLATLALVGIAAGVALYRRSSYARPWFLVVGPSDYGRTALDAVLDGPLAPNRGFRLGWRYIARQLGLSVWGAGDGVVVDVAGNIAFPPRLADLAGWRRAIRLLQRHRPARPVDGLVLAIPTTTLRQDDTAARELGAMLRDRLAHIQGHFGFILPAYVVVTHCDELQGFTAFANALPQPQRATMLGWSNDRASAAVQDAVGGDLTALDRMAFDGGWIDEGMVALERSLARVQVALLGSCHSPEDAAGLMAMSKEVTRLAGPLRLALDEGLRPNVYHGACFLRGFYLCDSTSFADDLLHRKIFRERGLAIPRPEVAVARLRGRLAAQVVCAVLTVALALGTAWSYLRLRAAQPAYARVLTTGTALTAGQPGTDVQERLIRDRVFIDQAAEIRRGRISELGTRLFIPASLPTERRLSATVRDVFAVMLVDFRAGLEDKWEDWNLNAAFGPGDRMGPLGPDLKETAPHKALDRFADGYQRFAENYDRYERLGRREGAGDLAAAGGILEYLTGAGLSATSLAPALARAVRETRSAPIDCRIFQDPDTGTSLVAVRASELLMQFGIVSFDDGEADAARWRNVVAGASRFRDGWTSVSESPTATDRTLAGLIDDTTRFSEAVRAWAAFRGPSRSVAIPVFGKPPFKQRPPAAGFCDALRPDLSADMRAVETLRDRLTPRLLDDEVPPFGRLLEEGESGLAFTGGVANLKAGLDDLRRQAFWQQLPADLTVALPATPTWRKEDIDAALKIGDAFDAYRAGAFRDLEDSYRIDVLALIEASVAQLVSSTLAASATPRRADATRAEEITRLGVQLAAMDRLTRWLEHDAEFGNDILVNLEKQASAALDAIDREASSGYFFSRRTGSPTTSAAVFESWRNIEATGPAADAAKRWSAAVDEHRDDARQFANRARPIVEYLSARTMSSERIRRWGAIAADIADYDQKRPGGAFGALETVMREGIPAMVPDRSCGLAGSGAQSRGISVFDAVRTDLIDEGIRQCLEVRYGSIAAEFNRLLSSRFPFSSGAGAAQEATREQLAQFLRVYERQGGHFLGPLLAARSCRPDASAFVRRLETVYPLLTSVAPVPPGSPPSTAPGLALDVSPEFRVVTDLDTGGSQLGDWQLDIGRQTLRERVASKPAPWTSGDPVSVTVRFARDSPNRPVSPLPDPAVAATPTVLGDRTVRWDFGGDWALFRLLRAGRAASNGLSALRDLPPIVLGFKIPVVRDETRPALVGQVPQSPFTVYMRLAVSPKDKPFPLDVDDFPYEAPASAACPGL